METKGSNKSHAQARKWSERYRAAEKKLNLEMRLMTAYEIAGLNYRSTKMDEELMVAMSLSGGLMESQEKLNNRLVEIGARAIRCKGRTIY